MSGEQVNLEIINSGNTNFAGYKQGRVIYRAEPFKLRQPIIIANLKKNEVKTLDLSTQLQHDLLITGISADITSDDGKILQERSKDYDFTWVQTIIQTIDKTTNQVIREIVLFISSYPPYVNELTLSPHYFYKVQVNHDVNNITLVGEPFYQSTPIVFL